MSKARFREVASWRLLVGYSTRSTAPVRTMSPRLALGLWSKGQHDGGNRSGRPQSGQPGHAGVTVEDGTGNEHIERALLLNLVDDIDHIGAGHDLVPGAERSLDGPAERRRAADDENPAADHGADVVWSVPMHCPTGGGEASFWV